MNGAYSYTEPYKCACGKKPVAYVEYPLTPYDTQLVRVYTCVDCLIKHNATTSKEAK